MTNLTHTPEEVHFLSKSGDLSSSGQVCWTAEVDSHFGRLWLPLHEDQARMIWDEAASTGLVTAVKRITGGSYVVSLAAGNRLLAAANPGQAPYGESDELIMLMAIPETDCYLAWIAGEGARLRVIGEHEAHRILVRARSFQGAVHKTIVRQQPYLFNCKRHDGIGNDLAVSITADAVPVELEARFELDSDPDGLVDLIGAEQALLDLLHGRIAGAWRGAA